MPDADVCECVIKGHHDEDDDECSSTLTRYDGATLLCTRPAGHEGPHAACNVNQHPITTWGADDV